MPSVDHPQNRRRFPAERTQSKSTDQVGSSDEQEQPAQPQSTAAATPSAQVTTNMRRLAKPSNASRPFNCKFCNKAFKTQKDLNRHNRQSMCAKARSSSTPSPPPVPVKPPVPSGKWACSRCLTTCNNKYSVERHILNSCWKTCDECCESQNLYCDSHRQDDSRCSPCRDQGLVCTKRTEMVPNCIPVFIPSESNKVQEPDEDAQAAIPNTNKKRKAVESPKSTTKPPAKRKAPIRVGRSVNDDKPGPMGEEETTNNDSSGMLSNGLNGPDQTGPLPNRSRFSVEADTNDPEDPSLGWSPTVPTTRQGQRQQKRSLASTVASSLPTQPIRRHPYISAGPQMYNGLPAPGAVPPRAAVPRLYHDPPTPEELASARIPSNVGKVHLHRSLRQGHRQPPTLQQAQGEGDGDARAGFSPYVPLSDLHHEYQQSHTPHRVSNIPLVANRLPLDPNLVRIVQQAQGGERQQAASGHPRTARPASSVRVHSENDARRSKVTQLSLDGQQESRATILTAPVPESSPPRTENPRRAGVGRSRQSGGFVKDAPIQIYKDESQGQGPGHRSNGAAHKENRENVGPSSINSRPSSRQSSSQAPSRPQTSTPDVLSMAPTSAARSSGRTNKVKVPPSRDPAIAPTVTPSASPTPTDDDPLITLRIAGLERDDKRRPTNFTKLEIRGSQKFGPHLNAYCEQRGKQYRREWNFVRWMSIPGHPDRRRESGYVLKWEHTPTNFYEVDGIPGPGMKDNDVIEVHEGKLSNDSGDDSVDSDEDVDMSEGPVNAQVELGEKTGLEGAQGQGRRKQELQNNGVLTELQTAINDLRQENEKLRAETLALRASISQLPHSPVPLAGADFYGHAADANPLRGPVPQETITPTPQQSKATLRRQSTTNDREYSDGKASVVAYPVSDDDME